MEKADIVIDVPAPMGSAIDSAILRARYLFPEFEIEKRAGSIFAFGIPMDKAALFKKEISYLLYREHIRVEFAPHRRKALDRVYGDAS